MAVFHFYSLNSIFQLIFPLMLVQKWGWSEDKFNTA